jgi:hypothetical protein
MSKLPQSEEVLLNKLRAKELMRKAFQQIEDMGLLVVSFDATYNQKMDAASVDYITPEEWEHGTW